MSARNDTGPPLWLVTATTLLMLLMVSVIGLCAPEPVFAEPDDGYAVWHAQATAAGHDTSPLAYAEHQARLGDPRPLIRATWPEDARAVPIFSCESGGYRPEVIDGRVVGAAGEVNVAQIHPIWRATAARLGMTWEQMRYDVVMNLRFARWLYERSGWQPWTCARGS